MSRPSRSAVAAPTRRSCGVIRARVMPNSPRSEPANGLRGGRNEGGGERAAGQRHAVAGQVQHLRGWVRSTYTYCVSSVLKSSKASRYEPGMMFSTETATPPGSEGEAGDGVDETVTLQSAVSACSPASRSSTATTRTRGSGRPIRGSRRWRQRRPAARPRR